MIRGVSKKLKYPMYLETYNDWEPWLSLFYEDQEKYTLKQN